MSTRRSPPKRLTSLLRAVGPGVVVAATGVGAGDLIAATKAGAMFGLPLLWTAALGAILKFTLAEGIARWQLATGKTILQGWTESFGRPVRIYFLIYLILWTFIVSGALMSACGLAAHALFPAISVKLWAVIHALLALSFVWLRGYGALERAMKVVIGLMFVAILGSAVVHAPPASSLLRGLFIPSVPPESTILVMGVIGGVGGTLTLLSYNYWMKEKSWSGPGWLRAVRVDLGIGYLLTGLFGLAVIILGAMVLLPQGLTVTGSRGVVEMALVLGERFGRAGEVVFLVGFWGAVATSVLGVWQGVPYMFANYIGLLRKADPEEMDRLVSTKNRLYRLYLLFMTFPPMLLLLAERPIWLIVAYAAIGSLFMPFLATTLLILNNRGEAMGKLRNGFLANATLVCCLVLFAYLAIVELGAKVMGNL